MYLSIVFIHFFVVFCLFVFLFVCLFLWGFFSNNCFSVLLCRLFLCNLHVLLILYSAGSSLIGVQHYKRVIIIIIIIMNVLWCYMNKSCLNQTAPAWLGITDKTKPMCFSLSHRGNGRWTERRPLEEVKNRREEGRGGNQRKTCCIFRNRFSVSSESSQVSYDKERNGGYNRNLTQVSKRQVRLRRVKASGDRGCWRPGLLQVQKENILFKVHNNLIRLTRDRGKGSGSGMGTYILPTKKMTTRTIKR